MLRIFFWKIGLPSVIPKNTRQTIILCRVFFQKHSANHFFLPSVKFDTRQTICQVRDKKHSANSCLRTHRCRVLYAECYTRQSSCRVFLGLKLLYPVVNGGRWGKTVGQLGTRGRTAGGQAFKSHGQDSRTRHMLHNHWASSGLKTMAHGARRLERRPKIPQELTSVRVYP